MVSFVAAEILTSQMYQLLDQARAVRRPVRAWFLEIDPVRDVCMCMCLCVRPRGY